MHRAWLKETQYQMLQLADIRQIQPPLLESKRTFLYFRLLGDDDRGDPVRRADRVPPQLPPAVPHHLLHRLRAPAGGGVRRELRQELLHRVQAGKEL